MSEGEQNQLSDKIISAFNQTNQANKLNPPRISDKRVTCFAPSIDSRRCNRQKKAPLCSASLPDATL